MQLLFGFQLYYALTQEKKRKRKIKTKQRKFEKSKG